jgi:hypothetical protein
VLVQFSKSVGKAPAAEPFYGQARESLWDVYPQGDALKAELVEFIKKAGDGPQLGFAGIALIPFHDPATVAPMLQRALDPRISATTRRCFLNAAPYVLGMGDAVYTGDGKLDKASQEFASRLLNFADQAARIGLGHIHANTLRVLLEQPPAARKSADYAAQVQRTSAYLQGTLDVRDPQLVAKALDSGNRMAFQNVMVALSFASNRDFYATLRGKRNDEITATMEHDVGSQALVWWQNYLDTHPGRGWDDAVISGFREAGYFVGQNLKSEQSQSELLRAMDDTNPIIRYNVYRVFNTLYGTHFDLDIAFFAEKYALSFMDPFSQKTANEARLKQFWLLGLKPTSGPTTNALTANAVRPANSSVIKAPALPPEESLGDAARRLRKQKKLQKAHN